MSQGSQSNVGAGPGMDTSIFSDEKQIWWGNDVLQVEDQLAAIDSTAQDTGNTPVTTLRAGLIMGQIASTKLWKQYDPAATDGTEVARGALKTSLSMLNNLAVAEQKQSFILIIGLLKADQLIGLDSAARVQLSKNFVFDDDVTSLSWGGPFLREQDKTGAYTVLPADNQTEFVAGGTTPFTLPAILPGYRFKFRQEDNTVMTVASAEGNNMIAFNDDAATSVAFLTASERIGGAFIIYSNQAGDKWIVENASAGAHTVTVV